MDARGFDGLLVYRDESPCPDEDAACPLRSGMCVTSGAVSTEEVELDETGRHR